MKTACTLLLLCLSLAGLAQNYPYNGTDTSAVMEYNDDKQWVYYERDGFLVGMAASRMSGDFGTYFRVDLLVQNLTDTAIILSSENVFAKVVTREGKVVKRDAFSFDEFNRRMKGAQNRSRLTNSIFSDSDDDQAEQLMEKIMDREREVKSQGYLKKNTLYPQECISGFLCLKWKRGTDLFVGVNIGDATYSFSWDLYRK